MDNIGNITEKNLAIKSTSVALGGYFEEFIRIKIAEGRYNNTSEVIRAGIRLLEENESRLVELKAAIRTGEKSGEAVDFDPEQHLKTLKTLKSKRRNG